MSLDSEMEMELPMAFTQNVTTHTLTVALQIPTMMVKQKCKFHTTLGLVKQAYCLIAILLLIYCQMAMQLSLPI